MIGNCPECNGKLSTEAAICPHCGYSKKDPASQPKPTPAQPSGQPEKTGVLSLDPKRNAKQLVTVFAVVGCLAIGWFVFSFATKSQRHGPLSPLGGPTTVTKVEQLGSETLTFKGGEVLFRSFGPMTRKRKDGFQKEFPFTQIDLSVLVISTDNPNYSWAFLPGRNALEAKGDWNDKKDKLEWRHIKGGQSINTSFSGADARNGGSFLFWNKNFADPIKFTYTAMGTYLAEEE